MDVAVETFFGEHAGCWVPGSGDVAARTMPGVGFLFTDGCVDNDDTKYNPISWSRLEAACSNERIGASAPPSQTSGCAHTRPRRRQ